MEPKTEDRKITGNVSHAKILGFRCLVISTLFPPDLFTGFILCMENIIYRETLGKRIDGSAVSR